MKTNKRVLALASVTAITISFTTFSLGEGKWINLLENGLTAWQDSRGWKTGDEVSVNPSNEKELIVSKPGGNIAIVEKKSRAAYLIRNTPRSPLEAVISALF